MDLEELKAWAHMLGVVLEPVSRIHPPAKWAISKHGYTAWVYEDQPAEHWLRMIKNVAGISEEDF